LQRLSRGLRFLQQRIELQQLQRPILPGERELPRLPAAVLQLHWQRMPLVRGELLPGQQ
jgi:hypothetical protein